MSTDENCKLANETGTDDIKGKTIETNKKSKTHKCQKTNNNSFKASTLNLNNSSKRNYSY